MMARGFRKVTPDLPEALIDRLIDLGHLEEGDRADIDQVLLALYQFLDHSPLGGALIPCVEPRTGVSSNWACPRSAPMAAVSQRIQGSTN
jgi:hypothetical protein